MYGNVSPLHFQQLYFKRLDSGFNTVGAIHLEKAERATLLMFAMAPDSYPSEYDTDDKD